ncbi:10989_t:CDS:2, partial [Rhizophagus irregularis]
FMMSDCLHLAMMIPFILNRFLKPTHFKKLELALFQRQTGVSRSDLAVNFWIKCWVLMARTMTIAFKHSFTEEDYIQLHECLDSERKLFSQIFTISSLDEYISNIVLKKRIPKKYAEKIVPNDSGFRRELASVYQEMGYEAAFFESSCRYYELICFSVEDNGINTQYRLHVGDVVTTISEEEGETFALLQSIFSHKRNNQRFAFIVIDKFEITNQKKLECPVYRLRDTQRIRPISELDTNSTAHFIHYCNDDECISGSCHDFGNDLYIKNMYFFKAI